MASAISRSSSRDAILRLKSESPKFKDVLRQKCQRRLQMNRWKHLDERRRISEEPLIQATLAQIIKEDLQSIYLSGGSLNIDKELEDLNEIENELQQDELQWLMNECDKILDNEDQLEKMLDDLDQVICPMCQKCMLEIKNNNLINVVWCQCGVSVQTNLEMLQIKDNITKCVDLHNNSCNCDPQFTVVNEGDGNHIYLLCYTCSSFIMLL